MLLLLATSAFAGDPIPGVDIGGGRNPGGQLLPSYDRMCKAAGGVAERHPTRPGMWWCVKPSSVSAKTPGAKKIDGMKPAPKKNN
jgi:hypothetical protein